MVDFILDNSDCRSVESLTWDFCSRFGPSCKIELYVSVFSVISHLKPDELINILRVGDETVPEEGVELVLRLKKSKKILTYLRGRRLSSEKF